MAREYLYRGSESGPNNFGLPNDSWWTAAGKLNNMTKEIYSLLSDTVSAGSSEFDAATAEQSIALADAACVAQNKSILFIPLSMIPYDITQCPASAGVRRVREGGDGSVYDVQAYGADGAGIVDATASFQAWLNASPQGVISAGTYKCGQITDTTTGRREIQASVGATIIPTAASWLKIVPPAPKFGIRLKNLTFQVGAAAAAMTPIVWLEGSNAGGIVDIEIDSLDFGDLNNVSCDLLWMRACFNGSVRNIYGNNAQGVRAILYSAKDFNSGNIHFDSITVANAAVAIQLGQAWNGAGQEQLNQITLTNFKGVRSSATTGCFNPVTLTAQATASATSLTVSSADATAVAAALNAGTPQWAVVASGGTVTGDVIKITSAAGTTLQLASPVPQTVANGTIIPVGTFGFVVLSNTIGVILTNPQMESVGFGLCAAGGFNIEIDGARLPTDSATIPQRGVYCTFNSSHVSIRKPIYSLAAGSGTALFHMTASSGGFNELIEPIAYSSGGGPTLWLNDQAPFGQSRLRQFASGYSNGTITYGATVTPDESYDTNLLSITDASAFNFAVPKYRAYGTIFTIDIANASGGVCATPTFASTYKLAGGAAFTPPGNGFHRRITFREDAGAIREVSRDTADVA